MDSGEKQKQPPSSSSFPLEPKIEHIADDLPPLNMNLPRLLESLHGTPIPPFLSKTYDLVDDSNLDPIISWAPAGHSFVVWDPMEFSRSVLPRHFKHNNFSSFVRQLNTYGFRKIGSDRWEFANEYFMRGKKTLLKNINRRRSCQVQHQGGASVEMVKYETESEIHKLTREKDLMMQEVVQLRQEHDMTLQQIDALNQRMQSAESRQEQMISFLARVLQSPAFLNHLKNLKEQREIGSTRVRRKFLKQQQQPTQSESDKPTDQKILKCSLDSSVSLLPGHEHGESSASPLVVSDRDESRTLPDHLLQDLVDRIDIDIGGQDSYIGSSKSEDLEGNNLMSSQTDSTGYFISFPDDIAPEPIVSDDNPPACEDIVRPETDAFKGKNVMNSETDAAAPGTEYLTAFPCDVSQEEVFQDWSAPDNDFANEEAFWNVGADAGGSLISSGPEVWDDLGAFDAQEMQAAGSCSLWGLGLHNLEEDLDVEKYVGDESSFQEHKDYHGQLNEDSPRKLEP